MPHRPVAWISHPSCQRYEHERGHPESAQRLIAIEEHLSACGLADFMLRLEPTEATAEALLRVHDLNYVDSILNANPGPDGVLVDPDTRLTANTIPAALAAAGASVLAVDAVLAQHAGLAFCAVRPPGHHAESDRAMGFCFFNNIAVAAAHALARGLSRLAILDFDVHYGNGTAAIFRDDPRVLLCSTYQYPLYPYWQAPHRLAHQVDSPLAPGAGSTEFREAVERDWQPAIQAHAPEMILVSAGFDAHACDPIADLLLSERDFGWIAQRILGWSDQWSQGRVVATLEGGYEPQALARSVEHFLRPFLT